MSPIKPSESYIKLLNEVDPKDLSQKNLMDFATGRKFDLLSNDFNFKTSDDSRILWLVEYFQKTKDKTLVICSNKHRVLEIAKKIKEILKLGISQFAEKIILFQKN